jgi:hypothetical protein
VAGLLALGTRESATVNMVLVFVKIIALIVFVVLCLPAFDASHFTPFMPNGFSAHVPAGAAPDSAKIGVMAAASLIFFAFYGFDAISTAAEEAKNPERDLAIGIVGSMIACTAIYMIVAAVAVGALSYTRFGSSPEPLALILREIDQGGIATIVAAAAAVALPTVLLAFLYGQSRIFLVMARDGFLPQSLAKVSKRGTPARITAMTAVFVAAIAGLAPLDVIAEPRQCGYAVRLRRGRRLRAGAAPPRPQPPAGVLDPGLADRGPGRHPGVPLSVLQPAGQDPALLPVRPHHRVGGLFRLRHAQERAGPGGEGRRVRLPIALFHSWGPSLQSASKQAFDVGRRSAWPSIWKPASS